MSCDVASGTSLVGSYTNERHTLRSSPKFHRYKAVFLKQKAQFGGEDEKIELEKKMERAINLKMICSNHTRMSLWSDEEWLKNYRQEQAENKELEKADEAS